MKAIRFHDSGGPEVLRYEEISDPQPAAGQALITVEACGLNFIDTYHRSGLYPVDLPCIPGMEAAGIVTDVGDGVTVCAVGDRVAYAGVLGAYAEKVAVEAGKLVKLPDGVDCETGAALMLQGLTAHYLTHSTYPLGNGDTVLVHAAAGGVGLLLTQIAKMLGARVFGTVSTAAKEDLARAAGADEVIRYTESDFEKEVLAHTEGRGVNVVYDGVARDTFEQSLNVLKPRGYMVLFGQSSGPVEPFDPAILNIKGSLFLTRPTMVNYIQTREELLGRANDLLQWVRDKRLDVRIGDRFPLADAAEAHKALQGRRTTGKVLLLP